MFLMPSISTLTKFKHLGSNYRITPNGFVEKIQFPGMEVGSSPFSVGSGLKIDDVRTIQNNSKNDLGEEPELLLVKPDLF